MKRGYVLIGSIFLALFLSVIIGISLIRSRLQLDEIDLRRASLYAFYAAEAGIESSINRLRQSPNWWQDECTPYCFSDERIIWQGQGQQQDIGLYTVQAADGGMLGNMPTVWILSRGRNIEPSARHIVTRTLRARLVVQNPATFFTSTARDLMINSGVDIAGNILSRDIRFNVFGQTAQERAIRVQGNVEYMRNRYGYPDPSITIDGNILKRSPTTFVGVDLNRYEELARDNGRYIDGNFNYSGTIDWGNLETANGLVFVRGDLHISGTVNQSIHCVATGNIYIDADIICSDTGGVEPQIGLSAGNDVIISASAPPEITIDAFVIADGGVFKAEGPLKSTLNFKGAIAARGREAASAVNLSSVYYIARNYVHDLELVNNLQIPFMSYLVNIINWQEVNPNDPFPPS